MSSGWDHSVSMEKTVVLSEIQLTLTISQGVPAQEVPLLLNPIKLWEVWAQILVDQLGIHHICADFMDSSRVMEEFQDLD